MALKLYTNVEKGLKLKGRRFLELIPMFVEVTGEKLVGDLFANTQPLSWIGLKFSKENFL